MMIVIQQSELVNQTSKVSKTTHWSVEKYRMKQKKTSFPKNHNFLLDIKKEAETFFFQDHPTMSKLKR